MCKISTLALSLILFFSSLIHAQEELVLLDSLQYSFAGANDIWGYATEDGKEYALVGLQTGTSIVDVTDPTDITPLFYIEGVTSTWRDIKTWEHHAYVVTEGGGGMLIIDLSDLPNSIDTITYHADSMLSKAHNLWIDEAGFAYAVGYNDMKNDIILHDRGVFILDLRENPMQPIPVGTYNTQYVHDVFVKNNIMYTSEIYQGQLGIIDVSDKANPIVLATQHTPFGFTHNAWPSDNGQYIFTTDERNDAFITAYDISDIEDIKEVDRYKSSPGQLVMPHNVHVQDDFLVISYYKDGVKILDAREPAALVETAFYDTSPLSGSGSQGCWGAYPFLPSGNILATDRAEGLFVFKPSYQRAAHVAGKIIDATTQLPLADATIRLKKSDYSGVVLAEDKSQFGGSYIVGTSTTDSVVLVSVQKYGYEPIETAVILKSGKTVTQDIYLTPVARINKTIKVVNALDKTPVNHAIVDLYHPEAPFQFHTNENGEIQLTDFVPETYDVTTYKWGWHTNHQSNLLILNPTDFINSTDNSTITIELQQGYYDDFFRDMDWTITNEEEIINGWEMATPIETLVGFEACNPNQDIANDLGTTCYVTGNNGNFPNESTLTNGKTMLTSPIFDLSNYIQPTLRFNHWFCTSSYDTTELFRVTIDNGQEQVVLVERNYMDTLQSQWTTYEASLQDIIPLTNKMQLIVEAVAKTPNVFTEAGFDVFNISGNIFSTPTSESDIQVTNYPNPFQATTTIQFHTTKPTTKPIELNIFNIAGQEIVNSRHSFPVITWKPNIPAGIYFLKLGNEEVGYVTRKLIKQ